MVANIFNEYYTNIVQYATGNPPVKLPLSETNIIDDILSYYKNHPSIIAIKDMGIYQPFKYTLASEETIYDIVKGLDTTKATGIDHISARLVKSAADVIKKPLTNIINKCVQSGKFPNSLKIGRITPLYKNPKEGSRLNKKDHRPVSVLVSFSKIFERYILNDMLSHVNAILSDKISAYRKGYSCHHVLLKLTEEWRKHLDQNHVVGAVLMDLSKAFDCLPHELLIAKLAAYGFERNSLKLLYSYLKNRKQAVKIKGKLSTFLEILAGVPQGSILGPILFNIFMNDIVTIFDHCELNNFADDNGLSAFDTEIPHLVEKLEHDTEKAINWLNQNYMIANPDKFKAIIIEKNGRDTSGIPLSIDNRTIKTF